MEIKEEKPTLIYHKVTDVARNRIIIPKTFVEKYGREYSMEVYKDKIIILPLNKEEE